MKIKVKVIAGSRQQKIEELSDGSLKVHLTAVREKGKANEQLIKLLADYYKVSKSRIEITRGHLASQKVVEIYD